MTPAARAQAAIAILDRILAGDPAEAALLRWSRASRFAGSGDRAAVRDLVFDALRRRRSRAALGGTLSGRGLLLGMCREEGLNPDALFSGLGHGPAPLTGPERAAGHPPSADEALDLPDWILPHWNAALGPDAPAVAAAMRDRAPLWLRVNALRTTPAEALAALATDGITARPWPALDSALEVVEGGRRVAASRAYRDGLVELQDLSPQLACVLLPAARRILDYCAGGGGKSLALAARKGTEVTAHDASPARMADLPSRAARAGARIHIAPAGKPEGRYDLVLADVPCSGSGTWRRTPDAKWRLDATGFEGLLVLQAQILGQAAAFVGSGGYLAYMTCSVLSAENDAQIARFLLQGGFEQVGQCLFTPLDASDGFFVAVLARR